MAITRTDANRPINFFCPFSFSRTFLTTYFAGKLKTNGDTACIPVSDTASLIWNVSQHLKDIYLRDEYAEILRGVM
jgi:hypothetical protein